MKSLKKKDDLKNQNLNKNNLANMEEIEDQPKRFPVEKFVNPNIKQNINRTNNNNFQDNNSQKNLRKGGGSENSGKSLKKSSSKKEKPFISATSAYGNYFDPPLQKGGNSKLDNYKK